MQYLMIDIEAPLMAWGKAARSNWRPTDAIPGRSHILGLLGAAVGIDRNDTERKLKFDASYQISVGVRKYGKPLTDYHTIQGLDLLKKNQAPRTRREEVFYDSLVGGGKETMVLTDREYLCDAKYVVCIKKVGEGMSLEDLRSSILQPYHFLFFGRLSCPPGKPLNPRVVEASSLEEAFGTQAISFLAFHWEGDPNEFGGAHETRKRSDDPIGNFRFLERQEYIKRVSR
jgi:CRISPR system Cascade subunit CasD